MARYGGEEFAVLLAGSTGADGVDVADRLRQAIASEPVPTERGPLAVTVSIGVAEHDGASMPLAALLDRADQALYRAKRAGRNRVIRW